MKDLPSSEAFSSSQADALRLSTQPCNDFAFDLGQVSSSQKLKGLMSYLARGAL